MQKTLIAKVISDRDDDVFYDVSIIQSKNGNDWECTCPHNTYRHKKCKHIDKVKSAVNGESVPGVFLVTEYSPNT
jgi:uncharacterized Zn finger protein